jgi:hypothetical protein
MDSQLASQSMSFAAAPPLPPTLSQDTELYGIESQQAFRTRWQSGPIGTAVFILAFDNPARLATKIGGDGVQLQNSAVDWTQIDKLATNGAPGQSITKQQLRTLKQHYASISDDDLIIEAMGDVPALYLLLKEAVEPLRSAFGEKALLQLEALEAEEEGIILRVVVNLPSTIDPPAELMRGFKRDWWFQHCSRSQAALVFDYETGNGF